jgi:putative ABC transport system permease protein
MNIFEVLRLSWKSIVVNKLRSLLTMLGVIIGVAAVIVMMAVSAGTEATIAEKINGLGSNLVFINSAFTRGGPNMGPQSLQGGLVYDDLLAIRERINGVAGATVEQETNVSIKYGTTTLEEVSLIGTTPDYPTVRNVEVANGRFVTDSDQERTAKVVILGSDIATQIFGEDDPVGQSIYVNNVKMNIVGVLAPKGLSGGTDFDQLIYAPIATVFKKFTPSQFARIQGDRVRSIIVSVDPNADMNKVIEQIQYLLIDRHGVTLDTADFSITTQESIIEAQESTTSSFRMLLGWVAGVSLIVGGIGIMNIMLVSVTERTREIGLRQAIGATPGDIQFQFLLEALMLSLLGGFIGVLAGVGGSWLFGEVSGMRTVVVSYSIILSFTSSALVGIIFGFLPARTAARLDPIVALRHE